jgi:hypothetical protein
MRTPIWGAGCAFDVGSTLAEMGRFVNWEQGGLREISSFQVIRQSAALRVCARSGLALLFLSDALLWCLLLRRTQPSHSTHPDAGRSLEVFLRMLRGFDQNMQKRRILDAIAVPSQTGKRDQHPTQSAVAIHKRANDLKLGMNDGQLHKKVRFIRVLVWNEWLHRCLNRTGDKRRCVNQRLLQFTQINLKIFRLIQILNHSHNGG